MPKFHRFKSFCIAGIVAATLLGTAATLLPIGIADAAEVTQAHGAWHGFFANEDSEHGFGISAEAGDRGLVALVVNGDNIALMMAHRDWRMTVGGKLHVRIKIDDAIFEGEALIVKGGMIELTGVSNDIVLSLARGKKASFKIGRNGPVWNVSLDGFAETLTDTVKAYAGSV
jgi:hypothetical protein